MNGSTASRNTKARSRRSAPADLFRYILNVKRSGLSVNRRVEALLAGDSLNESQNLAQPDHAEVAPASGRIAGMSVFTFPVALETLKLKNPRVLYVSFGDTDVVFPRRPLRPVPQVRRMTSTPT